MYANIVTHVLNHQKTLVQTQSTNIFIQYLPIGKDSVSQEMVPDS